MRFVTGILVVLSVGACRTDGSHSMPEGVIVAGSLSYQATTLAGEPLIRGRMTIDIRPDSTIVGTWSAEWAPGADRRVEVGDQIGNGTLVGRQMEDGDIDLNPGYADNNVILLPVRTDRGFTGTWYWSTIGGPRTYGKFTALRD